jgi:hypothetical protein
MNFSADGSSFTYLGSIFAPVLPTFIAENFSK